MNLNEDVLQKSKELNNLLLDKWLNQQLFSFQWFLIVFLVLVSYALFFYLSDKKRITELLLFGSLVAVAFTFYDTIGGFFGYWKNLINVAPIYPNFFGSNFTLVPLHSMLIYQYTSSWKSFFLWQIGYTALMIFGYFYLLLQHLQAFAYLKPFAVLIDFVLLSTVGIVARGIMVYLFRMQVRKGNMSSEHSLSKLIKEPNINSNAQRKN